MAAEQMEHAAPRWPNVNAPPGYRFKPTPRELIQCYLEPWVATEPGHQSPGEFYGIMAAADVYGEDPGTLASRFQHIAHDDGNWYFLSVARWKDGNASSKRMNRAVGALGTWHGSGKRIPVRGAGYRQSFEFRPAGGGKTAWLMEEFGTVRNDATGEDGVRVLCRLHLRPKAAVAAADGDDRQQQLEANDVPAPCNKRQRQLAAARQVEHHFDADYWTAAPDVGFSSSYATAAAPAPPDVGCSYATTSFHAAGAAAPLDDGSIMDSNSNAFSVLQPMCDGVQENNDPKLEPSDGVQENDDDDPKGDTDAS
ncbi:NAC domain-containing protein 58-like [Miscanthus floridulus]|uniref:NAC domain-containing protein 58-like n=1 Tax=Miscanthus floridulus TaxID=154761 RepID=UPI00345B38DD